MAESGRLARRRRVGDIKREEGPLIGMPFG
jgi:hypothetical protein